MRNEADSSGFELGFAAFLIGKKTRSCRCAAWKIYHEIIPVNDKRELIYCKEGLKECKIKLPYFSEIISAIERAHFSEK